MYTKFSMFLILEKLSVRDSVSTEISEILVNFE